MQTLTATSANVPVWTIGDRLAKARREAGIKSAKQMALLVGVDEKTIRNWENGTTRATHTACTTYAKITGYPVEWIEGPNFGGDDHAMRATRCTRALIAA